MSWQDRRSGVWRKGFNVDSGGETYGLLVHDDGSRAGVGGGQLHGGGLLGGVDGRHCADLYGFLELNWLFLLRLRVDV